MVLDGVNLNGVIFFGLIYVCGYVSLVNKGRYLFNLMVVDYGIRLFLQYYICLLDFLSRFGYFVEVEKLLKLMLFEFDEVIWVVLLSVCRKYKNI